MGLFRDVRDLCIRMDSWSRTINEVIDRVAVLEAGRVDDTNARIERECRSRDNSDTWHRCEAMPEDVLGCEQQHVGEFVDRDVYGGRITIWDRSAGAAYWVVRLTGRNSELGITHCPYCGVELPMPEESAAADD